MTDLLFDCLKNESLGPAIKEKEAGHLSKDVLEGLTNFKVYPRSIAAANRTLYFLGRREKAKLLGLISENPRSGEMFEGHQEKASLEGKQVYVTVAPALPGNAALLPFARAAWPRFSLNSQSAKTSVRPDSSTSLR